jgi:hypothetical protein
MRAIATGMIATYPVGGVAWDYGQYLVGLEQLGFDVYYLEDTGCPTYDPIQRLYADDCTYALRFLHDSLARLSPNLAERWHFRDVNGNCYGIARDKLIDIVAGADIFLNVSGGTLLREEYMPCRCKVLVDTDPGWNHFVNYPKWDAKPGWHGTHGFRGHDHFFTYAERLGHSDCVLHDFGLSWHPTRPPVLMERWKLAGKGKSWTTVMTWNNFQKPVKYEGRVYGTKELEFSKIERAPAQCPAAEFEIATGGSGAPVEKWREIGWHVVDSHGISESLDQYRDYVQSSRGELSVAKNLYVATHSGWFSCRTACYLAASRPAIIQDTGFSQILPTGRGLFAFDDNQGAIEAVAEVECDYLKHSAAAREIAHEYLDAKRILRSMLRQVDLM